jgi:hypothetical protein
MKRTLAVERAGQVADQEWVTFPGGELEGTRPKALCQACRARLQQAAKAGLGRTAESRRPLCFGCYRAELDREKALKAAGELDTASEARFQDALPFEPINRLRLERLRAQRATARVSMQSGIGRYVDKRRQAQMAARHALQRIAAGLRDRSANPVNPVNPMNPVNPVNPEWSAAVHAAELQLPESWLPFVVSR